MNLFSRFYYTFKIIKERDNMAMVYATLIIKGIKKYSQVPKTINEQVKQILIDLEVEYLLEQ